MVEPCTDLLSIRPCGHRGRNVCLAFLAKLHCAGCNYSHERHDVATLDDDELAPIVQQKLQEIQSWFTRTQLWPLSLSSVAPVPFVFAPPSEPHGYFHQQPPYSAETQEQANGSTSSFANTDPSKVVEVEPRGLQLPMPTLSQESLSGAPEEGTAASIMISTEGNAPSDATGGWRHVPNEDDGWTLSSSAAGSVMRMSPPYQAQQLAATTTLQASYSPVAAPAPSLPLLPPQQQQQQQHGWQRGQQYSRSELPMIEFSSPSLGNPLPSTEDGYYTDARRASAEIQLNSDSGRGRELLQLPTHVPLPIQATPPTLSQRGHAKSASSTSFAQQAQPLNNPGLNVNAITATPTGRKVSFDVYHGTEQDQPSIAATPKRRLRRRPTNPDVNLLVDPFGFPVVEDTRYDVIKRVIAPQLPVPARARAALDPVSWPHRYV